MKGQNNIWQQNAFILVPGLEYVITIQIGKNYWELEKTSFEFSKNGAKIRNSNSADSNFTSKIEDQSRKMISSTLRLCDLLKFFRISSRIPRR